MSPTNKDLKIAMKLALEFNAGIVALCTVYYGNMDTTKNNRRFIEEYQRLVKDYTTKLEGVFNHEVS